MAKAKKRKAAAPMKVTPSAEAMFYARKCGIPVEEAERILREAAEEDDYAIAKQATRIGPSETTKAPRIQ